MLLRSELKLRVNAACWFCFHHRKRYSRKKVGTHNLIQILQGKQGKSGERPPGSGFSRKVSLASLSYALHKCSLFCTTCVGFARSAELHISFFIHALSCRCARDGVGSVGFTSTFRTDTHATWRGRPKTSAVGVMRMKGAPP